MTSSSVEHHHHHQSAPQEETTLQHWLGPLAILLDEETFNNNSKLMITLALILSFRIITFFQKDTLQMYYSRSSNLMKGLMKDSKVKQMTYTPHTLAINGHMQAILSLFCEIYLNLFFSIKYEREMFTLSDGGTIALDWVIDHEGGIPRKNS